jgi:Rhs element Vgr protein
MADAPSVEDIDLASAVVRVDGKVVSSAHRIERLETTKQVNRISSATVTLFDGSVAEEDFKLSESDTFLPGKAIEIGIGYHGESTTVFKGVVVKQGVQVTRARECRLVVTCCDKAASMTIARHKAQFDAQSDGTVLKTLIEQYGLTADVDASGEQHEQLIQYFATDWDYLVSRAEANGAIVLVDDDAVSVKPPAFADPTESFSFGTSLIDIDIEMDARSQLGSVQAQTWDPSTQGILAQTASEPAWQGQGNVSGKTLSKALASTDFELQSAGILTQAGLKSWADAQLLKSRLSRIRGRGTLIGNAGVKPGQLIELQGLGARFDGNAFVSRVRQTIETGLWKTEVSFGLPNSWFGQNPESVSSPAAGALVPAAEGLQIGKVKQIHDDPDGQRRVKVSMPLLAEGDAAIWMRLAGGYASVNSGLYFMPEIDDEVVVGFLNADPAAPIVLGALQSGKRNAPYVPEQTNAKKAIVTKNQLKITFDDEKKTILIETPGAHSVLMSDENKSITVKDTSGNQLVMDKSGIALSSPADIKISATGSIKISGDGGVSVVSSANVAMSGQNTTVKADMALSAQGQMQAEFKSGGEVTIQGLMVMIN